ncbi:MAG: type III secretion system export apparatus subunit SctV [Deltaproteobacteria bacterium]|nr:type III secretion system export apparatus subunit SctV [Deltaproteobacteria bacterium]
MASGAKPPGGLLRFRPRGLGDVLLAAFVVAIVGMLVIPLPTPLLDVLITSNIATGVVLLLVALYVPDALSFSSFPTLLLVTTLYRLALNVSSTRLILLQADAGEVIEAFGQFVVQGNYVVGAVVFLILTLIQFLVVAKGSERVAEVAARFTLDAMPGKQMAIDADLRAGGIDHAEAKRRRRALQRESQLYGAMDGAMKFVKGDAIAGIVICVVNVIGGLAIGVLMRDMPVVDALKLYALLTIGDGLVSQIPSLLISVAAGIVVTRVASEDPDASLGGDIAKQIAGQPRSLAVASGFLLLLALVPGLPGLPFLLLGGVAGIVAWQLGRRRPAQAAATREQASAKKEAERETKAREAYIAIVTPVGVDLGTDLAEQLLDAAGGGAFLGEHVPNARDALFYELGITLPGVRVRAAGAELAPGGYVIRIQEIPVARGELTPGKLLALEPVERLAALGVQGEPTTDPATGAAAAWIPPEARATLELVGVTVLAPGAVLARHLTSVAMRRAADLVGIHEVQTMLDGVERAYPSLVKNVVPKPVSLALLADVLRRMVEEGVSIRPMREILEALAVFAPNEKDPVALTELVRAALRRPITHRFAPDGTLVVYLLDPTIEDVVRSAIQRTSTGSYLALDPDSARDIVTAARREIGQADPRSLGGAARPTVLLTQADVRRYVRRLLETDLPDLVVLSYQELSPDVVVQPVARIDVGGP